MALVYNANPNLKAAGVPVPFSADQVEEYIKCKNDPIYFIENYIKIVSIDKGLVPFKLHEYQKKMILGFHENRKVIVRAARQIGKTTTVAAYFCYYILFHDNKTLAILANKASTAREILSRVQMAYEHLPKWLQQGVTTWNKGDLELENGSRIIAASTSSSAIRGYSINILFLDEFAFVPTNLADEFFTSVYPTISSGETSKIFVASTPKGMNHFYKMWTEAEEGINGFHHLFVHWSDVPGRDKKWGDDQRRVLGEIKFAQEMDCEFLGSSDTLISGTKLRNIPFIQPIYLSDTQDFTIFQKPVPGNNYVMTVDTSRGTSQDYSAFTIVDVSKVPYTVVAKYRNNTISSMLYPNVVFKIAKQYNDAWVLVESNDVGAQVADILYHEMEYENTLMSNKDTVTNWGSSGLGIRTTNKVKRIGCSTLKTLIEEDKLVINDYDILFELSNFISKGGTYKADDGYNDDLAMCLVLFSYLTTQPIFKELGDEDLRQKLFEDKMRQIEEELTPIGFFDDGREPEEEKIYNF
jgi:hypothetical protein